MGSRRVTTYVEDGEEYDVILQAERDDRAAPSDLRNLYVRARSGELIPLGSVVSLSELAEPGSLNRFNRLRAEVFKHFAVERLFLIGEKNLCELLRERRAALSKTQAQCVAHDCTKDARVIDTVVLVKFAVFARNQCVGEMLRVIFKIEQAAPFGVELADEFAITIEHL